MKNNKRLKLKLLYKQKNKFNYKNTRYKEKDWFYQTSNFRQFDEKGIFLKNRSFKLSNRYLKEIFSLNVFKSTFLTIILPCVVFSLISLIVFLAYGLFHYRRNFAFIFENDNLRIFFIFLAILFASFACFLLVKILVFKERAYYGNLKGNRGYVVINKTEYLKRLAIYDKHIEKAYIFFAPLATERLIIRELDEFDACDYYDMAANPNVSKYMGWKVHESIIDSIKLIQRARIDYNEANIFKLGISLKEEKTIIGYIGLSRYDLSATTCQIVYAIAEKYWGKAYVKEALNGFISYLKANNKTTIYAGHVDKNIASSKVLLHCGFIRDPQRDTKMMIHDKEEQINNYIYDERTKKT